MKMKHLIIPTSSARHFFTFKLPALIPKNAEVVLPTGNKEGRYRFPDGEVYLRVPEAIHASDVTIVHSGYPDPNDGLIELYMLLNVIGQYSQLRRLGLEVIFTAMPYARQDKAYYQGELNAAETLCKTLVRKYGVTQITTIDAHFANERWVKKLPIFNVSASGMLIDAARRDRPGIIFMAPDAGSTRRAHIKGAKKIRKNSYEVQVSLGDEFSRMVKGRVVGVVDDILATGTTLERFYHETKKNGADKVFALITHGVCQEGINRTRSLYDGLYLTNTINGPEANVPVNDLVWSLILKSIRH